METKPRKLEVSGHRGYHSKETDNTRKAFQRAIDEGIDWIEFDVKRSKDGIPIVFHDGIISKLMDGSGSIEDYTVEELRKLKYKDGQEIQSLKEMFEQCAGKIGIMLEVKSDGIAQPIMELVKKFGIEDKLIIQSFKQHHVKNCYEQYPDDRIIFGFNIGFTGKTFIFSKFYARRVFNKKIKPYLNFIKFIHPDGPLLCDEFIELSLENGLFTILGAKKTWTYVNKYDKWGVKIINCNNPKYCVSEIKKKAPNRYFFSKSMDICRLPQ